MSKAFLSNATVAAFSSLVDKTKNICDIKSKAPDATNRDLSIFDSGRHVKPKLSVIIIVSNKPTKPNPEHTIAQSENWKLCIDSD